MLRHVWMGYEMSMDFGDRNVSREQEVGDSGYVYVYVGGCDMANRISTYIMATNKYTYHDIRSSVSKWATSHFSLPACSFFHSYMDDTKLHPISLAAACYSLTAIP